MAPEWLKLSALHSATLLTSSRKGLVTVVNPTTPGTLTSNGQTGELTTALDSWREIPFPSANAQKVAWRNRGAFTINHAKASKGFARCAGLDVDNEKLEP